MIVSYDTLPNSPNAQSPNDTAKFDSRGGITLSIDNNAGQPDGQLPGDPDGDEVLVRYQVSATQGQWGCDEATRNYCSAWTDETEFDVPSSWLSDGGSYYWRVQSGDVCTQPETLCDMTKPDGSTLAWKDSGTRTFTVGLKNWGTDDRYAMWSEDAGNGITLNVNEANGNLFTQVPIDTLATPIGRVKIGLAYNSQAAAEGIDRGLGDGWRLYAGPESSGLRMPIEIEELTPAPYSGVRVRFRSGHGRDLRVARAPHLRPGRLGLGRGQGEPERDLDLPGARRRRVRVRLVRHAHQGPARLDQAEVRARGEPEPALRLQRRWASDLGHRSLGPGDHVRLDARERDEAPDRVSTRGLPAGTGSSTIRACPRVRRTITDPENETVEFLYGTYGPDVMLNPPYCWIR